MNKEYTANKELVYNDRNKITLSQNNVIIFVMYICAGLGVIFPALNLVTLIIVSVCMFILTYNNMMLYVFPLAILFNDALGSVSGGFSIYYVFMACFIVDRIKHSKQYSYSNKKIACIILAIIINLQLFISASQSLQRSIIGIFSLIWAVEAIDFVVSSKQVNKFLSIFTFTVCYEIILSLFGGIETVSAGAYGKLISRAGLVGHGSAGDPNIAGFTIIIALICTLMLVAPKTTKVIRVVILGIGLIRTISLSNIGVAVICIMIYYLAKAREEHKTSSLFKVFLAITSFLVILSILYYVAPMLKFEALNSLVDRIDEALKLINVGDYNDVSSGRVDILNLAVNFFNGQGILNKLFGGNGAYVLGLATHNTYMEHILRFGIIGFTVLLVWGLVRFFASFKRTHSNVNETKQSGIITLKILTAIFIFTLAVNSGIPVIYWMIILYYL